MSLYTDPIADMLTRIRNAIGARHSHAEVPSSKMKVCIAEILKSEGYISDFSILEGKVWDCIRLELRYLPDRSNAITEIIRRSKPGRRTYVKADEIPKVRNGLGTAIISTSKGVLTDRDAKKQHIGGEYVCSVW
jgi:small subunit ribosomal protein S8